MWHESPQPMGTASAHIGRSSKETKNRTTKLEGSIGWTSRRGLTLAQKTHRILCSARISCVRLQGTVSQTTLWLAPVSGRLLALWLFLTLVWLRSLKHTPEQDSMEVDCSHPAPSLPLLSASILPLSRYHSALSR